MHIHNLMESKHRNAAALLVLALSYFVYRSLLTLYRAETAGKAISFVIWTYLEYVLCVGIYRLQFHPLAKYPGPWWAALTDWYTVFHLIVGDRHLDFYRLHSKYGKFVRFGPNRISVNSATALREIYAVRANTQKSQVYGSFKYFFNNIDMSMTEIDRNKHAFKRRVNTRALNSQSIKGMEEQILKNVRFFCDTLIDENLLDDFGWSPARNMSKVVSYLISDIMGDLTFSKNWNVQRDSTNRHFVEDGGMATAGIHLTGHMPSLFVFNMHRILFRPLINGVLQLAQLSDSITAWRVAQGGSLAGVDLFSALLTAIDPETGRGFTRGELISEASLLIIGGTDTTITGSVSTLFYLLHNQTRLASVCDEVRNAFAAQEEIVIGPQLEGCRFLTACINESLRLSPPVGSLLPREVLPGGLVVEDRLLPQGIDVGVPHYALHHNSDYYPDPFVFQPERWIVGAVGPGQFSDVEVAAAQAAFTAFGVGRTSCIGRYLAYQEMQLILARLLWEFDMRLEPGSSLGEGAPGKGWGRHRKDEFQTFDRFISVHDGPMVQFRRRL